MARQSPRGFVSLSIKETGSSTRASSQGTAVIMQGRSIERAWKPIGGRERISMVNPFRPRFHLNRDEAILPSSWAITERAREATNRFFDDSSMKMFPGGAGGLIGEDCKYLYSEQGYIPTIWSLLANCYDYSVQMEQLGNPLPVLFTSIDSTGKSKVLPSVTSPYHRVPGFKNSHPNQRSRRPLADAQSATIPEGSGPTRTPHKVGDDCAMARRNLRGQHRPCTNKKFPSPQGGDDHGGILGGQASLTLGPDLDTST
ncbi:hypothetical protein N7512_000581 [Penicillium capsulatum]|nr:hypothetical protein N7512_000581 [Penicillium capsulatum]